MDNNERINDPGIRLDKDTQINLVVSNSDDDTTIDLGRVFHNMKVTKRLWAWVLVLCLVVGICAPLLLYQFGEHYITVSSVVTLQYEIDAGEPDPRTGEIKEHDYIPVPDLTAPDGEPLDLNRITSAYVLQRALNGLTLSQPITVAQLRNNIAIQTILTEDSRRQQEVASSMIADKNTGAYNQVQNIELVYENRFVVTLTNGFGAEDEKRKIVLEDSEIALILDRVLDSYNDYMVETYADLKLPDDEISAIRADSLDLQESLDLLRTATDNLAKYCEEQLESVRTYRSYRTGLSLDNLAEALKQVREVNIDYLYSYVYTNTLVKDKTTMATNYRFQLRDAQTRLDALNEQIATTQAILDTYKNDEIFVSMQESDTSKSTKTTTDYYNELILSQAVNYGGAATLQTTIADLQDKLAALEAGDTDASTEKAEEELTRTMETTRKVYEMIRAQMEEIQSAAFYTNYAEHSTAMGKLDNFLKASLKTVIIGAVAGAVIAFGLWFLSGLATEMRRGRKDEEEKEAERV